jgi:hypothetical protein
MFPLEQKNNACFKYSICTAKRTSTQMTTTTATTTTSSSVNGSATTDAVIPCCVYYYRQTHYRSDPDGVYRYKMEAILPCRKGVDDAAQARKYATHAIERSALIDADLDRLQLFNSICIPECNASSIRFIFASVHHGAYACSVTPTGQLSIDRYYCEPPAYVGRDDVLLPPDGDLDTFHAASIYTTMHDYIQTTTPNRYIHVGLSFVPCGTFFMPIWLGDGGGALRALLAQWYEQKLLLAKTESLVTVRLRNGDCSVRHVLPRAHEKHMRLMACRSSSP